MEYYSVIKQLHVATVVVSFVLFFARGVWMITDSPLLQRRGVRVVPHINDTVLLAAGVTLAVLLHQYPLVHGWLTAKVLALVAYIGLGMVALRRGRTKGIRVAAWIAALLAFVYMLAVAVTKSVNPLVQ